MFLTSCPALQDGSRRVLLSGCNFHFQRAIDLKAADVSRGTDSKKVLDSLVLLRVVLLLIRILFVDFHLIQDE